MDMDTIIQMDKQLLLAINGSDSLFVDYLAKTLTTAATWIPLYVSLFYVVVKNNDNFRRIICILACAGLCVLFAGTVDDLLVKPLAARLRPTHDFQIGMLVDTVDGYRGGKYGFFSAHAANTFSIAVFFSLLMRSRLVTLLLVGWSLTNCWTRLYLGVTIRSTSFADFYGAEALVREFIFSTDMLTGDCYIPKMIMCHPNIHRLAIDIPTYILWR